ncbi:MAG: hypothetical protein M1812_006652 [Candelaria pacifica]|nr:MAG: hypothetical protein M1812_006652 [Candelaria pacifica]
MIIGTQQGLSHVANVSEDLSKCAPSAGKHPWWIQVECRESSAAPSHLHFGKVIEGMNDQYSPSPGNGDEDNLARHLTSHNHHHGLPHSSAQQSFSSAEYQRSSASPIDPALENEGMSNFSHSNSHLNAHTNASPRIQDRNGGTQHFPRKLYTNIDPSTAFASTPSSISPRFPSAAPKSQKHPLVTYSPSDRSLPQRDVTNETIDDAYVSFILACNPAVALSTDTAELRRGFRAPPKSDGKSFSTYTLLDLIRKFESKEIKTWTQLAIQLGVEPPMIEKNQSAQKVQQYAVRLKRWMHAMHVDAFFEYCLGKPHIYFAQIPPAHDPYPESGRDGVPAEEDLALRFLHPESKPKRGRRKTEDKDNESDKGMSPAKRPHLDTSSATVDIDGFGGAPSGFFGQSALPSMHVDDMEHYVDHNDPWAAASAVTPSSLTASTPGQGLTPHPVSSGSGGRQFRWRLNARENTPTTPHPQSAITPAVSHPPDSAFDEPLSAITPPSTSNKGRSRRRHGPAVSSAWSSGGNPLTGKLRGRPPSNRSVRDGPFSTFPANPKAKEGPVIDLGGNSPVPPSENGKETGQISSQHFHFPPQTLPVRASHQPSVYGKPNRLHLQVPQHIGGTVQLATPTLLVNGESDHPSSDPIGKGRETEPGFFDDSGGGGGDGDSDYSFSNDTQHPDVPPEITPGDIIASFTTELLNADVAGHAPLQADEAKKLAEAVMLRITKGSNHLDSEKSYLVHSATWLGVARHLGLGTWPAASGRRLIRIRRSQVSSVNHDSCYELEWTLHLGPLTGSFKIQNVIVAADRPSGYSSADARRGSESGASFSSSHGGEDSSFANSLHGGHPTETEWKRKFLVMERKAREKDEEMGRLKRRVMDAVL